MPEYVGGGRWLAILYCFALGAVGGVVLIERLVHPPPVATASVPQPRIDTDTLDASMQARLYCLGYANAILDHADSASFVKRADVVLALCQEERRKRGLPTVRFK